MKKAILVLTIAGFLLSCGGKDPNSASSQAKAKLDEQQQDTSPPNDGKGIGEITQVTLNDPLNQGMIEKGKAIYEMKCAACHKLSGARVVGPSWEGITKKRKPEWIMNMITNVDVMLEKDPEAQKLLEECLTRMPNQNVSIGDARDILEFMLSLDAEV